MNAIVLLIIVGAVTSADVAPEYMFSSASKSWPDAEVACEQWGGHLATVSYQSQQDYLALQIPSRGNWHWIGLNDRDREGTFVWANPIGDTGYRKWTPGSEPNHNGDCVMMYETWGDHPCDQAYPYVCQREENCPERDIGYYGNDIGGKRTAVSWVECSNLCRSVSNCQFWTFTPSGEACYLKSSGNGRGEASSKISGSRTCGTTENCPERDIGYYSNDIGGKRTAESWVECSNLCRLLTRSCQFWTFTPSGEACYLKSGGNGRADAPSKISGSRTCGTTVAATAQPSPTAEECPQTHPYAFNNGNFCCKTNEEDTYCGGRQLSITSWCCLGGNRSCARGKCTDHKG